MPWVQGKGFLPRNVDFGSVEGYWKLKNARLVEVIVGGWAGDLSHLFVETHI